MSSAIQRALVELNLQIFQIKIFKDDRIEDDSFQHLTDQDLIRLGVETIGDRIKIEGSNEDDCDYDTNISNYRSS